MKKLLSLLQKLFKKKKEESTSLSFVKKNLFDNNIYCEIIWKNSNPDKIELYGCNNFRDIREYCGELFNYSLIHSNSPRSNVYIPRIVYNIDWSYIFRHGVSLKEFKLTFGDYSNSTKKYSVILEAINGYSNRIIDSFASTNKVFIDPYELTENIDKFIRYSETYEMKK